MLVRYALRICAVQALKGRTFVGDNVFDSRLGALDTDSSGQLQTGQRKPFVSIYTDDSEAKVDQADNFYQIGMVDVVFESGVAATMAVRDEETGELTVVEGMPATDEGFEFLLDAVDRQIADAMADPANEWAQLWHGLSLGFSSLKRIRGSNATEGVRLAGRQLRVTMDTIYDPLFGESIEGTVWQRFFDKLAASDDETLVDGGAVFQSLVGAGQAAAPDWQGYQRLFGLTGSQLRAIGLGPIGGDDNRATPEFSGAGAAVSGSDPVTVTGTEDD